MNEDEWEEPQSKADRRGLYFLLFIFLGLPVLLTLFAFSGLVAWN